MAQSIRIGDKIKSVKIKSYMVEYYAQEMGFSVLEAKQEIKEIVVRGCNLIPSRYVDSDYVTQHMLLQIQGI